MGGEAQDGQGPTQPSAEGKLADGAASTDIGSYASSTRR